MSFEEQFPSLKDKELITQSRDDRAEVNLLLYFEQDISKYCLDKQKVREAINRYLICDYCVDGRHSSYCTKCELLKELGMNK